MAANLDSVLNQLRAAGLIVDGGLRYGKLTRCKVEGDREKRGWYSLHEIIGNDGQALIVGSFGIWQGADNGAQKVQIERDREMSRDQLDAIRKRLAEDRREADRQRAADARRAAERAMATWAKLHPTGESGYLEAKGVLAHGIKFSPSGAIAIPVADINGRIHGLELIRTKALAEKQRKPAKEFWPTGMIKAGHFHLIGVVEWIILIAEGYATAASLFEATGFPVAVAFDSGNLAAVAEAMHHRYPRAKILIAADDDVLATHRQKGPDGRETCGARFELDKHPTECPACGAPHKRINAGIVAASSAALRVAGAYLAPQFADDAGRRARFIERGHKLTDWNDLHQAETLTAVGAQIRTRLLALGWTPPTGATAPEPSHGGEGQAFRTPLQPIANYDETLRRFALVYGMKGVVFDRQEHQLVAVSDFRDACVRKDVFRYWAEHAGREIVRISEVGFDPSETDPAIRCNLWGGWPTVPKAGDCQPLLDLLRYMVSGDKHAHGLYEWVLRWLAYPLQHPGAKMKTTLVLHGPQGTGKNMFFEAYMAIYGEYGRVINQDAIEDKFNDYASRKLFLIADEVVARSDLYHVKNKLKAFITGDWIRINPKNMGAYDERNHVNLVFLSNEAMPVVLEEDDRRHCVIYTPEKLQADFYKRVLASLRNGAVAALHDYLLNVDLGDFDAGTLPPDTDAKAELINQSLDSTSRFFYALEAHEMVPGKLGPALAADVFRLYRGYCAANGLRAAPMPRLQNILVRKHGVTQAKKRYLKGFEVTPNPVSILLLGDLERPLQQTEQDWLGEQIDRFANAATDWLKAHGHA